MKTVLLSPATFAGDGGVARMMRLYLKGLCELAEPPADQVTSIALNDDAATSEQLKRYATPALTRHIGCNRSKPACLRAALAAARQSDRLVCGHLHLAPIAWMAQKLNRQLQYIIIAHGIDVWRTYSTLEKRALQSARNVWCVSGYTRRRVQENFPELDPSKLIILPNALDPELGPANADDAPITNPAHAGRILSVGRLTTVDVDKGFETLIDAMSLVRQEIPEATLRIVGGGNDLERLKARANDRNVGEACVFLGAVDDAALAREYDACAVFALPSRKEGFGLVYLEAMIRGKPCLAARAGGAPEVVNDSVGALIEYGDIPAIARELTHLLRRPPDREKIRAHAQTFSFAAFKRRLAEALS